MFEAVIAFFSMFFVDVLHSIYIKRVSKDGVVSSGLLSGLIYIFMCVATINYIENNWMLIPATLGAAIGTSVGVIINKKYQASREVSDISSLS